MTSGRICKTEGCRKKAQENRTICRSCRTAKERENLAWYTFRSKIRSSKRRGIDFTLTFEEFRDLCKRTGYLARKGRFKDSLHIDRIDESQGYHNWNVQTLTNSQNVIKSLDYRYDGRRMVFRMRTTIIDSTPDPDVPF